MDPGVSWGELALVIGALLLAGSVTGLLAGMLGIGGGGILLPALYELFGALGVDDAVRMHLAVGTSLAVIVPTSIRSFPAHRARGAVDMDRLRSMALPVVVGVGLGGLRARYASDDVLKLVWVGAATMIALNALWRLRRPGLDADEDWRRRLRDRDDDLLWPADPARGRDLLGLRAADRDSGRSPSSGRAGVPPAWRRAHSAMSICWARC